MDSESELQSLEYAKETSPTINVYGLLFERKDASCFAGIFGFSRKQSLFPFVGLNDVTELKLVEEKKRIKSRKREGKMENMVNLVFLDIDKKKHLKNH